MVKLDNLKRALKSLENAIVPPPLNDRERDGAIQRFEYTFELTWKTAKKVLELSGIISNSPRNTIREIALQNWISDATLWMNFLAARNLTTHIYNENEAEKVFGVINDFYSECNKLINKLEIELKHEE